MSKLIVRMSAAFPRVVDTIDVNGHAIDPPVGFTNAVHLDPEMLTSVETLLMACDVKMTEAAGMYPGTFNAWSQFQDDVKEAWDTIPM